LAKFVGETVANYAPQKCSLYLPCTPNNAYRMISMCPLPKVAKASLADIFVAQNCQQFFGGNVGNYVPQKCSPYLPCTPNDTNRMISICVALPKVAKASLADIFVAQNCRQFVGETIGNFAPQKFSPYLPCTPYDTNRIISICVASPKVSKASKASIFVAQSADSFANKLCQHQQTLILSILLRLESFPCHFFSWLA
jgi:hypothetical protein